MENGESWVFRGRKRTGSETDFAPDLETPGLHLHHSLEETFVIYVSAGSSCPTEPGVLQRASPEGDCWRSHPPLRRIHKESFPWAGQKASSPSQHFTGLDGS